VFFSDISDLRTIGLSRFDIDWRYAAAFLYSCDIQVRNTGLLGVTELLAGDAVEFNENSVRQYSAWDPRTVVRGALIRDYEQAKSLLTSTTQFCIDAWGSVFTNIVHRLSGGLDSAVVLGSLMQAPVRPRITCTHQFSDHPRDDERPYARLAAAAANVPLLEQPRATVQGQFDATLRSGQKFPRPNIQAIFGTSDLDVNTKIATDLNAEATWTGQGGDHIFFQTRTSFGAADYMLCNGLNFGLVRAVSDSARFSREPYLSVLHSAWRLARDRTSMQTQQVLKLLNHTVPFVNSDALPADLESYTAHDWTTEASDIPKGKQLQIFFLAELLNRHKPLPNVEPVPEHHPLISQPLIELCLRIPSYQLLRGGRHRALARDAFADRVPTEILLREDKGDTTTVVTDTIRRSEPFIRELLLDGMLVKQQVISRKALEPYIVHGQSFRPEHVWPLLSCIATELWALAWTESSPAFPA
jgi:asparagine synthase (glutamine-hydrolysing)